MPEISAPAAVNSVPLGNSRNAPEVHLDLPIAAGPYEPTWASIEKNYPGTPDWLREAKFGIWVHFGPQSAGESGDWYARRLYTEGMPAYGSHLKKFGHPSETGYMDVLHAWNPTKLDPAKLVETYKAAGARYLIIQGVHHDQFDLWNSQFQPWNAKNLGPRRDLLGEWAKAARAADIHFGVTFHHEYSWWWWQTAFMSDKTGPKAGVQYDGRLTLADGKGKWWEGLDPRLLYGIDLREYAGVEAAAISGWSPPPAGIFTRHAEYAKWYATWWALRIMDAVNKYDPDFIYTDGTSSQPFSGSGTGTGIKADAMQRVIADYYNRALARRGRVDVFSIVKFRPKTNGTVNTRETDLPQQIKTDQPWIGEAPVGDWFYRPGFVYSSKAVLRYVIETVARDGNAAVCISLRPDGSLDDGSIKELKEVGEWMKINGSAIYGSHAWSVLGEGQTDAQGRLLSTPGGTIGNNQARVAFTTRDFRFTVGKNGKLNAICLAVPAPGSVLTITSLGAAAKRLDKPVKAVRLLGDAEKPLVWKQDAKGLSITCPAAMPFATAVVFEIE